MRITALLFTLMITMSCSQDKNEDADPRATVIPADDDSEAAELNHSSRQPSYYHLVEAPEGEFPMQDSLGMTGGFVIPEGLYKQMNLDSICTYWGGNENNRVVYQILFKARLAEADLYLLSAEGGGYAEHHLISLDPITQSIIASERTAFEDVNEGYTWSRSEISDTSFHISVWEDVITTSGHVEHWVTPFKITPDGQFLEQVASQ